MRPEARTTVRLCGPLGVELAGEEIELPGRQGRLAFAYLVVNRDRGVSRDELIDLLWPARPPADPGEALSVLLSRLRRALGGEAIAGRRELRARLPADVWIDLEAAQHAAREAESAVARSDWPAALDAAQAAAAVAGRGFLTGDDAPWVEDRRREVEELSLRALEALATAGVAAGGPQLTLAEDAARRLVDAAPFRESGHRLLMSALAARGNVAEALRAYDELRVLLRDELGTAPGAEVQGLHRRLLATGPVTAPAEPPAREERKLVTALWAELPEHEPRPDPEDLGPARAEAQRQVEEVLQRFGAAVAEAGDDAALGLFGVPVAHEDEPERAVDAAHELCRRRLAARVGIATGEALVSLAGGRPHATGQVTTAAARLGASAPPGGALVDDATRRATRSDPERFPRHTGPARFVGRERELAQLRALHAGVLEEGRPRLVTIVGQAGLGKTRLLEELLGVLDTAVYRGRCLPYGEGITYWALREILWDAAAIRLDDTAASAAAKLTALVEGVLAPRGETAEEIARVAMALAVSAGITLPGNALVKVSPESVHEEIGLAWPRFVDALAARSPTLLAIEDLHWAEGPLLDMVEAIHARAEHRLMVVLTARPELAELRGGWGYRPGMAQLVLEPLSTAASRELAADLLPGRAADVTERVVRTAEGNPFFAEEIARHLESEPERAIPDTVRALLAARIDVLPPAEKQVLQRAAVVGRTFWAAALPGDEALGPGLRALEERGFVSARATSSLPGQRELRFAHGLTRDVAYHSLPRGERARAHAIAARWLERLAGDRRDEFVELLAHHYEAAAAPGSPDRDEMRAKAVAALLEAGQAARRRLATRLALRFADRALALAADDRERLAVLELRARSRHAAVQGEEALGAYLEALRLARSLGDAEAVSRLRALATLLCVRYQGAFTGDEWHRRAAELVEQGLAEAGEDAATFETGALLVGRSWGMAGWRGVRRRDLPAAKRDAERAVEIAQAISSPLLHAVALEGLTWITFEEGHREAAALGRRHRHAAATLGDRLEAHESLTVAAICFAHAGLFGQARRVAAEATQQAAGLSPHRGLHAAAAATMALARAGRLDELAEATDRVLELATAEGERICATGVMAVAGCCLALGETGDPRAEEALTLLRRLAPTSRSMVGWSYSIAEVVRPLVPLTETMERLAAAEPRNGAGTEVNRLRVELPARAVGGEWDALDALLAEARRLAEPGGAPALAWVADWAEATQLASAGRIPDALELALPATSALDAHGERYTAARLLADLLTAMAGDAPADLAALTAERLERMGARASGAAVRGLAV
jgi:DNA-binding SARP family transcriptional activator/tetratricopeptide (TPR) repeat protein